MIQLHSLAFGPFAEAEPLNSRFVPGHRKLRLTVDTERVPRLPDRRILSLLIQAFPGLSRHRCEVGAGLAGVATDGRGIVMLEGEHSANQAHLLEHVLLEMLSLIEGRPRLSGVTCAYTEPPERNDVFVECGDEALGVFVSRLAVEILNGALAGKPIAPVYGDAARVVGAVWSQEGNRGWTPVEASRVTGLANARAAAALRTLRGVGLLDEEVFAMNFSAEPLYRLTNGLQVHAARERAALALEPSSATPGA